jgi:pseudoazurin
MKMLALAALAAMVASPLAAKEITVKMLNMGSDKTPMVFEPGFIKAAPGDTVKFVAANPGHNAQTIPGFLPAGEAEQKGAMGKDFILKVTKPGLYGIKCLPHFSIGMVALVQVGNGPSSNLAAAKAVKLSPLATKRMATYLAQAK